MPESGLLISCATTAAILPMVAIFSTCSMCWCACLSSRVFSSTRSSRVRAQAVISACASCKRLLMSLNDCASSPISSFDFTGMWKPSSPLATRSVPAFKCAQRIADNDPDEQSAEKDHDAAARRRCRPAWCGVPAPG